MLSKKEGDFKMGSFNIWRKFMLESVLDNEALTISFFSNRDLSSKTSLRGFKNEFTFPIKFLNKKDRREIEFFETEGERTISNILLNSYIDVDKKYPKDPRFNPSGYTLKPTDNEIYQTNTKEILGRSIKIPLNTDAQASWYDLYSILKDLSPSFVATPLCHVPVENVMNFSILKREFEKHLGETIYFSDFPINFAVYKKGTEKTRNFQVMFLLFDGETFYLHSRFPEFKTHFEEFIQDLKDDDFVRNFLKLKTTFNQDSTG